MNTNDFNQLVASLPNLKRSAYYALKRWGFTPEEAHQDALIELWEISKQEKQPEKIAAYICRSLINRELDKLKLLKNKVEHVSLENVQPTTKEPYNEDGFLDLVKNIKQARMLFLFYVFGYSHIDLSIEYGIKVGAVKSRLFKAHKELI